METYFGLIRTPADAIKLFEACRLGLFPRVQRRLSEKERQSIRSGSVFVWDEREAGMRRWTDGKSWSASRVSGSFLTYREMEGKRGGGFGNGSNGNGGRKANGKTPESGRGSDEDHDDGEPEGYRYKADGLMKQSFSITTSTGQHLHLISYFTKSHSQSSDLPQPSTDPQLRQIVPAKGLYPESSWTDSSSAPALARAAMTTGQYIMPQPQPHAHPHQHQHGHHVQHHQQPLPPHHHPHYPHGAKPQAYGWPLSPVTTPPYSNGHAGAHYTTATPYAHPEHTPQHQHQHQHQHPHSHSHPHPHPHHIPPPAQNGYPSSYSSNRLPPPAMLLPQPPQQPPQPSHLPPQPHYPSPMTPHHPQSSPHTPQYAHHPPPPHVHSHAHAHHGPPQQGQAQHYAGRQIDSPRAQHLQAAAAAVMTTTLAPPHTTTPPVRALSASPPRSAQSEAPPAGHQLPSVGQASGKASLSALLLHPMPAGAERAGSVPTVGAGSPSSGNSPRLAGCGDKGLTEDARALSMLDRKFLV